jgi:guanine deaminase
MVTDTDTSIIQIAINTAIDEAKHGYSTGEGGPFSAIIIKDNKIIAKAHNTVLKDKDPTCHGEINCIRKASKVLNTYDLSDCILVTTSEPCCMCRGAILWSHIKSVIACSHLTVADKFGFNDINFEDKNNINLTFCDEDIENKIIEMFTDWQKNNGQLY